MRNHRTQRIRYESSSKPCLLRTAAGAGGRKDGSSVQRGGECVRHLPTQRRGTNASRRPVESRRCCRHRVPREKKKGGVVLPWRPRTPAAPWMNVAVATATAADRPCIRQANHRARTRRHTRWQARIAGVAIDPTENRTARARRREKAERTSRECLRVRHKRRSEGAQAFGVVFVSVEGICPVTRREAYHAAVVGRIVVMSRQRSRRHAGAVRSPANRRGSSSAVFRPPREWLVRVACAPGRFTTVAAATLNHAVKKRMVRRCCR